MKRFLAIILVLCLMVSVVPLQASAEIIGEGSCSDNGKVRWQMNSNGTLRIYGSGAMKDLSNSGGTYFAPWKDFKGDIKKVVVENGVTKIGDGAFSKYFMLKTVTLADSVKHIGKSAFAGTAVENIVLPAGLECIDASAFYDSAIRNITIPEKVNTVSNNLFFSCDLLVSATFLGAIEDIEEAAFGSCRSLESVTFEKGVSGRIGKQAFYACEKLTGFHFDEGIKDIDEMAFSDCACLTEISLPETLTSISNSAFWNTGVRSVTIPQSVEYMGSGVFSSCEALTDVTMYTATVEGMRGPLGGGDALAYVHIIGDAPVTDVNVFGGVENFFVIFYDEGTSGWEPPTWKGYVLELWGKEDTSKTGSCGGNLTWLLDNGVLTISGTGAMDDYDQENMPWYIYKHRVNRVVIEEGVTSIGAYAFYSHDKLCSVSIAGSVETIGNDAFDDCCMLGEIVIPDGVRSIGDYAFWYCTNLTSVIMADSVEKIGNSAFAECSQLESIRLSNSIAVLPNSLFHACGNLKTVNIPKSLTVVGNGAFYGCGQIEAVTLPETLETIKGSAFRQTGLKEVIIPASVTNINEYVFTGCTSLNSVRFLGDAPVFSFDSFQDVEVVCIYPSNNDTWTEDVRQDYCGNLVWITDDHVHNYTSTTVEPTCTEQGYVEHICSDCGYVCCDSLVDPLGHDMAKVACGEKKYCLREGCGYVGNNQTHNYVEETANFSVCTHCGAFFNGCRIFLNGTEAAQNTSVWIDGNEYQVITKDGSSYVNYPYNEADSLVTYTYNEPNAEDRHTQYPTGMKVWLLSREGETMRLTYAKELENLLQYSGSSIRISGKKGIRMITSIDKEKRKALIGSGLAGYKLVEYGTVLAWDSELGNASLILESVAAKSNYAYKRGVADPIYKDTGKLIQYTNVLVGFTDDQCIPDLAMRSYIILEDTSGKQITLYGGTLYRSIGYIAYQNRNAFKPKTSSYEYVWGIIRHVYGKQYDAEYKG